MFLEHLVAVPRVRLTALLSSQAAFLTIVDNACDCAVKLDNEFRIRNGADKLGPLLLHTQTNLVDSSFVHLIATEEDQTRFTNILKDSASHQSDSDLSKYVLHMYLRDASGTRVKVQIYWSRYPDLYGNSCFILGISEDDEYSRQPAQQNMLEVYVQVSFQYPIVGAAASTASRLPASALESNFLDWFQDSAEYEKFERLIQQGTNKLLHQEVFALPVLELCDVSLLPPGSNSSFISHLFISFPVLDVDTFEDGEYEVRIRIQPTRDASPPSIRPVVLGMPRESETKLAL